MSQAYNKRTQMETWISLLLLLSSIISQGRSHDSSIQDEGGEHSRHSIYDAVSPIDDHSSSQAISRDLQSLYPNLFFWNLWQGTEQLALQEGALWGVNQESVEDTWHDLQPVTDMLGLTGPVDSFNAEWTGFWMRGGHTCLADDAERLAEAVASPDCRIILLVPGRTYSIETDMDVLDDKTIIGSPTLRPILDGEEAERTFRVHNGAFLDVRHVLFYQGDGDEMLGDQVRTRFGGSIYLEAGGSIFAFDCLFTLQPYREAFINSQPEFIFGGDILITGGTATFIGCSFFAVTPGFANSVSTELGGSVLILAGTVTLTASNFMTSQIFAYNIGVGMHLAVFGGVVVMNGVSHTANLVFAAQGLCGRNIFIGGGVGIFTGIAVTDTMAFLAFFGVGLSIHIGGGLAIFTGCEITLINALSMKAGCGLGVAIGGGMGLFYGVAFSKDLGLTQFSLLGLFVFCAAGRLAFVGCPFGHQNAIADFNTLGGAIYLGAGQLILVGSPFSRECGLSSFYGLGGDLYLGAGDFIMIGSGMTTVSGINIFLGQGTEVFVGAGSAYFHKVAFSANFGINHYNRNAVGYYVGGRECEVKTQENEEGIYLKEKGYATCHPPVEGRGGAGSVVRVLLPQELAATSNDTLPQQQDSAAATTSNDTSSQQEESITKSTSNDTSPQQESITIITTNDTLPQQQNSTATNSTTTSLPPAVSKLVMEDVKSVQRLALWAANNSHRESPATFFLGDNISSCSICGVTGVDFQGPKSEECAIAPVCAHDNYSSSNSSPIQAQIFTRTTPNIKDKKRKERYNRKLFASKRRMERGLGVQAGDSTGASILTTPLSSSSSSSFGVGSTTVPDTYVVIANIALSCADYAAPCINSTELQLILEDTWLEGAVDSRLVVSDYASSLSLMQTMGIPDSTGAAQEAAKAAFAVPTTDACPQLQRFSAYVHTTDQGTYSLLKTHLLAEKNVTIDNILEEVIINGIDPLCSFDIQINGTFHVPPAVKNQMLYSNTQDDNSLGGSDVFSLPRVWININEPVVQVNGKYQIIISHFSEGERIGLRLIPSQDNPTAASTAWPLHYFPPFNSSIGNATWTWTVLPTFFKVSGTYYLKAFDAQQPGKFALSQAFDLEVPTSSSEGSAFAAASSSFTMPSASALLSQLSSKASRERRRDLSNGSNNASGNTAASSSQLSDTAMVRCMLAMQNDTASIGDMWRSLVDLPMSQKAFKNATIVQAILERTPVLQSAPEIKSLDKGDGWSDPIKVQTAVTTAMKDFISTAIEVMSPPSPAAGSSSPSSSKNWPDIIKKSMTDEDLALGQQVQATGNQTAMQQLMNNQAARHFGGNLPGYTMGDVGSNGQSALLQEFKSLMANSKLLKDVVNDDEIWRVLGLDEESTATAQ